MPEPRVCRCFEGTSAPVTASAEPSAMDSRMARAPPWDGGAGTDQGVPIQRTLVKNARRGRWARPTRVGRPAEVAVTVLGAAWTGSEDGSAGGTR
jgi:hypothetical protein